MSSMAFFTLVNLSILVCMASAAKRGSLCAASARTRAAEAALASFPSGSDFAECWRKEKVFLKLAWASSASKISIALEIPSASSARIFWRSSHSASISAHCLFTSSAKDKSAPISASVSLIARFFWACSSLASARSPFFDSTMAVPALISALLAAESSVNCASDVSSSSFKVTSSCEKSSTRPSRTPFTPSKPSPRWRKEFRVSRSSLLSLAEWSFISCCSTGRTTPDFDCRKAPASGLLMADWALLTPERSPSRRSRSSMYSLFCCFRNSVAVSRAASFLATSSSAFSISPLRRSLWAASSSTRAFSSRAVVSASAAALVLASVFS
mmetsp:Transcript_137922/g.326801  ORF Transcript_137922/g.326801 Transcript_137922/m.326801 type:complete len:327 (+) Transcript_137922:878-1858(+)